MEHFSLIIIALALLGFGAVSQRVRQSILTPPMAFVLIGLLAGPLLLDLLSFNVDSSWIVLLAEITLALILFTDAARINIRRLRKHHTIPVRLLGIGLPLTVVFGMVTAFWVFNDMTLWEAGIIAAILAPTDAALGQAVVSSRQVPVRIRQALNIESGLNDGIMVPVFLLFLSLAGAAHHLGESESWLFFAVKQVTLGPLTGIIVGYAGGKLVEVASRHRWMSRSYQDLAVIALAILAYALAETIGGNGFIATFTAGLTLSSSFHQVAERLHEFAEAEEQLLSLLVFMVFGIVMVPVAVRYLDWRIFLYAGLSLTIIRMLPVALSLIGTGLRRSTFFFLAWFGPRGVASIIFALLVIEQSGLPEREYILAVAVMTILISVVAHGVTAAPAAAWYARSVSETGKYVEEHRTVSEMPMRARTHSRSD